MNTLLRNALAVAGCVAATQAVAEVSFYENEGFQGKSFTTEDRIGNMERNGFADGASSAVVSGERWEVCENRRFRGRCMVLLPGRYPSLAALGLDDSIISARSVDRDAHIASNRYAPQPLADYDDHRHEHDYRRRENEQLFDAPVTSVHAVFGPPEQRCWVEKEQVTQQHSDANVPGALAGALIGGILGHQVGGGHGKDIATVGGAVAGAAVGANVGRDEEHTTTQDVQRCANVAGQGRPAFWDVAYNFRGQEHRVQLTDPPGATITVNGLGEPRS